MDSLYADSHKLSFGNYQHSSHGTLLHRGKLWVATIGSSIQLGIRMESPKERSRPVSLICWGRCLVYRVSSLEHVACWYFSHRKYLPRKSCGVYAKHVPRCRSI